VAKYTCCDYARRDRKEEADTYEVHGELFAFGEEQMAMVELQHVQYRSLSSIKRRQKRITEWYRMFSHRDDEHCVNIIDGGVH
jgi:hypothetical protein